MISSGLRQSGSAGSGWAAQPYPHAFRSPEEQLLASETRSCIDRAVDTLGPTQRDVIRLRYLEGMTTDEVCARLGISETNQRVALHRARSQVRRALEQYQRTN